MFPARAPEGSNPKDCGLTDTEKLLEVECGDGRPADEQAGYQLALLCSTLFISIVGGMITGEWSLCLHSEGFGTFALHEVVYGCTCCIGGFR